MARSRSRTAVSSRPISTPTRYCASTRRPRSRCTWSRALNRRVEWARPALQASFLQSRMRSLPPPESGCARCPSISTRSSNRFEANQSEPSKEKRRDSQSKSGLERERPCRKRPLVQRIRSAGRDGLFLQDAFREREGDEPRRAYRSSTCRVLHDVVGIRAAERRLYANGTQHRSSRDA